MPDETTVQDLLDSKGNKIHSIEPDATVFDALKVLSDHRIGALPVIENGKLVGIFSERDYARKIILEGKYSKDTAVRTAMTTEVCHVSPDESVKACMHLMTKNHFRHLPVVEGGTVVGVISISDIVRTILMSLL